MWNTVVVHRGQIIGRIEYDRTIDRFWLTVKGVRCPTPFYSRAAAEMYDAEQRKNGGGS